MMRKFIAFFIINLSVILSFAQCPNGELETYVEILTDDYGYENYWEIVPNNNNCGNGTIISGGNNAVGCNGGGNQNQAPGGYANNTTIIEGPFCLTENNNYKLINVDDWGDSGLNYTIKISGFPIYNFQGQGNLNSFLFEATEPLQNDIEAIKINIDNYVFVEPNQIKIKLKNVGSNIINSINLIYNVNGGADIVESVSNLNWQPFTEIEFEHSNLWTPNFEGSFTINAWADNINGSNDTNPTNDQVSITVAAIAGIPNIIDQYIESNITFTTIANSSNQVSIPTDLDFHPNLTNSELWVTLKGTENSGGKTITIYDAGKANQTEEVKQDGNAWHFMSLPTGIAFSKNGNFATSPGVYDANHDGGMPFTGPTLWSSDPLIYAQNAGPGTNGSHLDMLHASPYSQGIASEKENVFWVFDGNSNDIVRYDFVEDHGPGNSYHGDGIIRRYSDVSVLKDPNGNAPSHLVLKDNWLYVSDFGNNRVIRLNINTGFNGGNPSYGPFEELAEYSKITGYEWETVVSSSSNLTGPTGIDIIGNRMIISEFNTGDIIIYDISSIPAVELFQISTGSTGVAGVKIGPNGKIWYVNSYDNTIMRIDGDGIGVSNITNINNRKLVNVYDASGREVRHDTKNKILFYQYNDGTVEKNFNLK